MFVLLMPIEFSAVRTPPSRSTGIGSLRLASESRSRMSLGRKAGSPPNVIAEFVEGSSELLDGKPAYCGNGVDITFPPPMRLGDGSPALSARKLVCDANTAVGDDGVKKWNP